MQAASGKKSQQAHTGNTQTGSWKAWKSASADWTPWFSMH